MSLKKYINDKSPFPQSADEMDGAILLFEGHDRPRYIYPFNNETGYLGLDDWGQYWNKPVFISETTGRLDRSKYYSIIVVPLKTDISVGGLPIYGEATQPSIPRQPSAALRGMTYTIPTHTQTVVKDCGTNTTGTGGVATDATKAWAVNEHTGKLLRNVETGAQTLISANTSTVLTSAGAVFSIGDRYQILSIACTARLIYACEMASAASINTSDYYLVGVINNNTDTSYTLAGYVESADIWDFGAGHLQPPNANCVKTVGGIMFCGGGVHETRGIARYAGGFESRQAAADTAELITNGDFSDGATGWTFVATSGSPAPTFEVIDGEGAFIQAAWTVQPINFFDIQMRTASGFLFSMTEGKKYKIRFKMKTEEDPSETFRFEIRNLSATYISQNFTGGSADWEWFEFEKTALVSATDCWFAFFPDVGRDALNVWIDDISVRELSPAITVEVIDDVFDGGEIEKVVRLTLGEALAPLTDIHEGSYLTISSASREKNIVQNVRVLRVDPAGRWLEFIHNAAVTNATFSVTEPIVTGAGDGDISTPVPSESAISEYWEMVCAGADSLFVPGAPSYNGGNTGLGTLSTPQINQDNNAVTAETWTLTCTSTLQIFSATAPSKTGVGSGAISTPVMNQSAAAAETWLLTCEETSNVYTAGAASKTGGTGDGVIDQPVAGTAATDELWSLECTSTPKSYAHTAPVKTGSGTGSVTLLTLSAAPETGAWEARCTGPTTEKYVSSVTGTFENISYAGTPTANTSIQLVVETVYTPVEYNKMYVSGYVKEDGGAKSSFKVYNGNKWASFSRAGITFTFAPQNTFSPFKSYTGGTLNISTRASTGATFTVTGPSGVTGTFLSGAAAAYVNSSLSIKISDGAARWALNDRFNFNITSTTLGGATFIATGAVSGTQVSFPITSGNLDSNWKNVNNRFSIRIRDGAVKWEVGAIIQFTISVSLGGNAKFSVVGTSSGARDQLTSGVNYSNPIFSNLLVQDGINPWTEGDTITFDVTAQNQNGATFSVIGSENGVKANLTSGAAYNNGFFAATLSDHPTVKWAVGDVITFAVTETEGAGDGKVFTVIGERSGPQNNLVVNVPYSNSFFSITVEAPPESGETAWAIGDRIYFVITKAPTPLIDETMQFFVTPNYIQGSTGIDRTHFSEGMKDALFQFPSDAGAPYKISWVDPVRQRIGLGAKYIGNNTSGLLKPVDVKSNYSLYYSDARNPHRIRAGAIIDIGDSITGLSSVSDNVLVFGANSLSRVSVDSLGSAPVLISDNIRCPAPFSVVKGEKLVMFYDGTGFSITDGVTVTSVTAYKLKDYLSNLNKAYEKNIRGVYDRENKRFEFVFPMGGGTLNNYGVYITEGSWNCYPFSRPDCNALWTNYDNGNLRVYHGTTGLLTGQAGEIWRHEGDSDGAATGTLTLQSVSGQTATVTSPGESAVKSGDTVSFYPVTSQQAVKQMIVRSVNAIGSDPFTYEITFDATYDLSVYEPGDLLLTGFIPFDYGIKWSDFSSPQYRHQVRALHIDLEETTGKIYVDHFLDMLTTPVATNEYDVTPQTTKIVVPFRMGKCYKYGFRLRGYSSTGVKISAFEIIFDTQI